MAVRTRASGGLSFRRSALRTVWEGAAYAAGASPGELAADETYWAEIRKAFDLDPSLIYLNSAGCSPAPRHVLDGMIHDLRYSNQAPVEYMWRQLEPRIEIVRRELAWSSGVIRRKWRHAERVGSKRDRDPRSRSATGR